MMLEKKLRRLIYKAPFSACAGSLAWIRAANQILGLTGEGGEACSPESDYRPKKRYRPRYKKNCTNLILVYG